MEYFENSIFQTDRLLLRPYIEKDFQFMRDLDSDERVVKYLGHGKIRSENETLKNVKKILGDYNQYGLGLYMVEDIKSGELLGRSGLIDLKLYGSSDHMQA